MSHTDREEKREPREREFPYVRQCCAGGDESEAHRGSGALECVRLHVPPPPRGWLRVRPIREAPGLRARVIAAHTHD